MKVQPLHIDSIKRYASVLEASPLFNNLTFEQLQIFLSSSRCILKEYKKNAFIAISREPMEGIGIFLEGHALLTRENTLGQRTIMTDLQPSSMFGEVLLFTERPLWPATIQATKPSKVLFVPLESFTNPFPECQVCQVQMLSNLMKDMSEKALLLTRKVHYLTLKGMRDKIFAYFIDMHLQQKKNPITLPHNRQEMADVLNVSRTALSRELSRLQDEGIIAFKGKTVHLLNLDAIEEYAF